MFNLINKPYSSITGFSYPNPDFPTLKTTINITQQTQTYNTTIQNI